MGDVLHRAWRLGVHATALAWLLVVAPLELATTLTGLVSGPPGPIGATGLALVGLRVLVTALGLMLGRRLLQGPRSTPDTRSMAIAWAIADLGTLGSALASGHLPSNLAPGDAPLVWLVYAAAAVIVVAGSRD